MSGHHGRAACACLRWSLQSRPVGRHLASGNKLLYAGSREWSGQARLPAGLAVLAHRQFTTKPAPSVSSNGKTPYDSNDASSSSGQESETVTRLRAALLENASANTSTGETLTAEAPSSSAQSSILNGVPATGTEPKLTGVPQENDTFLFHQPSKHLLNLNLNADNKKEVSLFFRANKEVVNLSSVRDTIKEDVAKELEAQKAEGDWVPRLNSINDLMWADMKLDRSELKDNYMKLAKIRLTGLVVITQMAGYAMAPGVFDPLTFLFVSLGTALTSASANSINQFLEVPYDSQMNRTKNRPLVRGTLTPLHAAVFATGTGVAGVALLAMGVNTLTAGLGLFNLCLYTMCYTPLKRHSMVNTWVGSLVGAIPPMMGWAACSGALDPGAWLLAGIMYAWQFPHFNALSWNLRGDYSRAGYRMMSVLNPGLCKRVTLRYSVGMIGLCTLAPALDLTSWAFALDSLPLNLYLTYLAWNFYRNADSNSSRKLFRFTLIHIPLIFALMLLVKKRKHEDGEKGPPIGPMASPLLARLASSMQHGKSSS